MGDAGGVTLKVINFDPQVSKFALEPLDVASLGLNRVIHFSNRVVKGLNLLRASRETFSNAQGEGVVEFMLHEFELGHYIRGAAIAGWGGGSGGWGGGGEEVISAAIPAATRVPFAFVALFPFAPFGGWGGWGTLLGMGGFIHGCEGVKIVPDVPADVVEVGGCIMAITTVAACGSDCGTELAEGAALGSE